MSDAHSSKNRNWWPAGIVATFIMFVGGTAGLVVLSARNSVDLVRPDYYEQELRFQEQINGRSQAMALSEPVRVAYDAGQRRLTLTLPVAHAAAHATGEIQLYRPSSAGMDRHVALQLDSQGRQTLDAAALSDGLWRVRLSWRVGDEHFACEEKVIIGKTRTS